VQTKGFFHSNKRLWPRTCVGSIEIWHIWLLEHRAQSRKSQPMIAFSQQGGWLMSLLHSLV